LALRLSFKIQQFVVRVGEYRGYIIVETDKPTDVHYVTNVFAAFEFKVPSPGHILGAQRKFAPDRLVERFGDFELDDQLESDGVRD
jgi:hypothetical protein